MNWEVINFSGFSFFPPLPPTISARISSGKPPPSPRTSPSPPTHWFHYFHLVIFSHSATSPAQRLFHTRLNSQLITALIQTVIALIALINHLSCGKAFVGICNRCWHWLFIQGGMSGRGRDAWWNFNFILKDSYSEGPDDWILRILLPHQLTFCSLNLSLLPDGRRIICLQGSF